MDEEVVRIHPPSVYRAHSLLPGAATGSAAQISGQAPEPNSLHGADELSYGAPGQPSAHAAPAGLSNRASDQGISCWLLDVSCWLRLASQSRNEGICRKAFLALFGARGHLIQSLMNICSMCHVKMDTCDPTQEHTVLP